MKKRSLYLKAICYAFLFIVACSEPSKDRSDNGEHVLTNQTTLTFLVFDKSATLSFFDTYKPLEYSNEVLLDAFRDSLLPVIYNEDKIDQSQTAIRAYSGNTRPPGESNFNLAAQIVDATLGKDGENYFGASLTYYFFYCCLPSRFQHKWAQTTFGDFEFNATFFQRILEQSKELDELIAGRTGYWNEELTAVFNGDVYTEITPAIAAKIKKAIVESDAFNEEPFRSEKSNLLEFLNRTIAGEWRLILMNWS